MSRLPIRVRLTAVFALAMTAMLVGAGVFVYARLRSDLDDTVDAGLQARARGVAALVAQGGPGLDRTGLGAPGEGEEGFAQLLDSEGTVLDSSGGAREPGLTSSQARAAAVARLVVERELAGVEGLTRVLAVPAPRGGRVVVVVGQSLDDRDETLAGLVRSFAIGGPIAVLLASLIGYALAATALAPVEAMRRRAQSISLSGERERLPLPRAEDEIRRLGETLNDMLDRLRAAFDRERALVADAGHELRTPIAVLKTELDGLLRRGGHPPEVTEALAAAAEEADALAQLADDLLVLAQVAEGALPLAVEPVAVDAALAGARERFADRAARAGRSIAVGAPPGLAVQADPRRLRQALANLVDNALRHGAGTVTLSARAAADVAGEIEIEVADEGAGFPPDVVPRAFERFARADEARARAGTGLGLAIVQAIAQAHGGSAAIGEGAGGARVRVRLPAAPSHAHLSGPGDDPRRNVSE